MKESVFIGNMKYRRKNTKQSRPSSSTAFLECVIIDSPCSQADKYMNRDFYDKSMKFGTQLGHAI